MSSVCTTIFKAGIFKVGIFKAGIFKAGIFTENFENVLCCHRTAWLPLVFTWITTTCFRKLL